jgi:hypothetical protein
LNWK